MQAACLLCQDSLYGFDALLNKPGIRGPAMDSSRGAVARKRKAPGPSAWPRVKAPTSVKHEGPRASLSGRLTERQQLALALEESRRDSLPVQVAKGPEKGSPQPSESGDQSSSMRCCDDEVATHRSSSKSRSKQQPASGEDCQPCSPCRTTSHEQASTSGRAGAVASSAAKTGGTFFSSSMSSGTSKQSASTAFKIPFSRGRKGGLGASGAHCMPVRLPDPESEPCPSEPASPFSQADRQAAAANVSSSTSELTAGELQLAEAAGLPQQMQDCGAGPAESTVLSNSHQPICGHSERLGSLTPSISQSATPTSYSEAPQHRKKPRTELGHAAPEKGQPAFPSPAARPAGIKIRVKLGSAEAKARGAAVAPSAAPLEHVLPGKRVAEPDSADALVSMHELGSKRPKLEAPVEGLSSSVQPTRVPSFRKPRSKPSKAKMGFGARLHGSRPSIPSSVFEEPNALLGQSSHVENGMAPLARPKPWSLPSSVLPLQTLAGWRS
ncbi:hypothetical protein WJX84_000440 [Apatococcus fuscideae]|uniref:Uncharacterized protein n=1 Tax=Apatococcus fuscideae TaxID=2026836 RepID=A0AAW1SV30_9CHLO